MALGKTNIGYIMPIKHKCNNVLHLKDVLFIFLSFSEDVFIIPYSTSLSLWSWWRTTGKLCVALRDTSGLGGQNKKLHVHIAPSSFSPSIANV